MTAEEAERRSTLIAGVVVVAAALVLRFWGLSHTGISHWDAGSYTAGPLGVGPYAERELVLFQTPPLVPGLFRGLFALCGVKDLVPAAAMALIGTATVAALLLAGLRWVGAAAALIGAAALAGMEYHLLFSRQALADVPFALFLLLAAWAFSEGARRSSVSAFVLAGIAAGAALLTKYHGLLALLVPALWMGVTPQARGAWKGWLVAAGVAAIPAAWLAWEIGRRLGIAAFLESRGEWLSEPGLYLLPMTAENLRLSLGEWVSPVVLVPAAAGCLRMLLRRSSGDRLLLVWIALLLAVLPCYRFYPRLLVPLLPPLALAAGVGLDWLLCWRPRRASVAIVTALLLVAGAWHARGTLSVRDRGYAEAAEFLRAAPADPRPDLLVTQHSILFYLHGSPQPLVTYDDPRALEVLREGNYRFLVGDLRLIHASEFRRDIEEGGDALELAATIPNPLPSSTIVNCAGFEGLRALRLGSTPPETRATLETIRLWKRR